jgi:hypothetical protein
MVAAGDIVEIRIGRPHLSPLVLEYEKPNMGLSMSSSFFRGTSFLGLGFVFGRLF